MQKIQWNKVTWYSKLLAALVFLATFVIGFNLGVLAEQRHIEDSITASPSHSHTDTETPGSSTGGTLGAHCGGFIKNAPTCAKGFHCQLKVSMPDTGGTCVAD